MSTAEQTGKLETSKARTARGRIDAVIDVDNSPPKPAQVSQAKRNKACRRKKAMPQANAPANEDKVWTTVEIIEVLLEHCIDARAAAVNNVVQQVAPRAERIKLIDVKSTSPAIYSGFKTEAWKAWAKKVKAFTSA